jgi:peptide deformylase
VKDNPRYPYKPNIPLTVLVNPVLEPLGEARFENYEGCLSVPNLRGLVKRHAEIRVTGMDRHGEPIDRVVRGITAGTFQHEVDHLDGLVFLDRVEDSRTLATWDQWKAHHEAAFIETVRAVVARYGS